MDTTSEENVYIIFLKYNPKGNKLHLILSSHELIDTTNITYNKFMDPENPCGCGGVFNGSSNLFQEKKKTYIVNSEEEKKNLLNLMKKTIKSLYKTFEFERNVNTHSTEDTNYMENFLFAAILTSEKNFMEQIFSTFSNAVKNTIIEEQSIFSCFEYEEIEDFKKFLAQKKKMI